MFYFTGDRIEPTNLTYQQRVKEKNIKRIFDDLRSGACDSRAELVRAMDLSATSVSALVDELCARGYVGESGPKQTAQPGRRPIQLTLNENARQIAFFSVRARGVQFSLLNLKCAVIERVFVPVEASRFRGGDAGEYYSSVFEEILMKRSRFFKAEETTCIGISIPGNYRPAMKTFAMDSSVGIRFSEESMNAFEQRVGLPVYIVNNAVCLAYAEKKYLESGDGSGAEPIQALIYINISDSVGASIISRGDIFTGPTRTAGDIGHMTIDYRGRPCPCGNRGCLERYVNLNAILEAAQDACVKAGIEPPKTFDELAANYQSQPAVDAVLEETAEYLSSGIFNTICTLGIQRFVLGGGIEALGDSMLERVREHIVRRSNLHFDRVDLSYAGAGSCADDIGFAHYFLDKAFTITY